MTDPVGNVGFWDVYFPGAQGDGFWGYRYGGQRLSAADQKVKYLAISIFVGLLTGGVGGVFCLRYLITKNIMRQIKALPPPTGTTPAPPVTAGIPNGRNTCYLASMLQGINSVGALRDKIALCGDPISRSITRQLGKLNSGQEVSRGAINRFRDLLIQAGCPISRRGPQDIEEVFQFLHRELGYPSIHGIDAAGQPVEVPYIGFYSDQGEFTIDHVDFTLDPDQDYLYFQRTNTSAAPRAIPHQVTLDDDGDIFEVRALSCWHKGHFICYRFLPDENQWLKIDDDKVTKVAAPTPRHIVWQAFYEKVPPADSGPPASDELASGSP